jgi:hypothetical protein
MIYFFTKISYLDEEVECTEPSPSVSIPCSELNGKLSTVNGLACPG